MNEYAAPISLCTENEWAEGSKFTVTGWGLKSVCIMIEQELSSETTISTRRIFLSNQIVQKFSFSLWFWASDLLLDRF